MSGGTSRLTVPNAPTVLDANVFPLTYVRDLLLNLDWFPRQRLNRGPIIRVRWSESILSEVRNDALPAVGWSAEPIERFLSALQARFPTALIADSDFPTLADPWPDPDDAHVVAAAISVRNPIAVIVTRNTRDFPTDRLPDSIVVLTPDELLCRLLDEGHGPNVVAVLEYARTVMYRRRPFASLDDLLDRIRPAAPALVSRLRSRRA